MPKRTIILLVILSCALAFSMTRWVDDPAILNVYVQEDGVVLIDDTPVAIDDLGPLFEKTKADDPRTQVTIYAESSMPAADVVHIAQKAEEAGLIVELNTRVID